MIVIGMINGKFCPQTVCDICGAVITNYKLAAVVHKKIEKDEDMQKILYHVHKGLCHELMEKRLGKTGWHEMETYLICLLDNINFTVTEDQINKINELNSILS